jgi:hypothetical protein
VVETFFKLRLIPKHLTGSEAPDCESSAKLTRTSRAEIHAVRMNLCFRACIRFVSNLNDLVQYRAASNGSFEIES